MWPVLGPCFNSLQFMVHPESTMGDNLTPAKLGSLLRTGLRLEYVSLGWMTVEGLASVWAGFASGSLSLVVFGGDSFIELASAYAVANYLRKRVGGESDSRVLHRTERITQVLLLALIPSIVVGALYSYLAGVRAETSTLGIGVAILAVLIMPALWLGKRRIGRQTDCLPLSIDAVESATCFLMSIALLGGLLAISILGLWWMDYLATGIILAFVGKEVGETFRKQD